MKTQIEKIDRLIREIEMDEYLNEETLPKIREAKGFIKTLHEQLRIQLVSKQRELLTSYEKQHYTPNEWLLASEQCKKEIDNFLTNNCS